MISLRLHASSFIQAGDKQDGAAARRFKRTYLLDIAFTVVVVVIAATAIRRGGSATMDGGIVVATFVETMPTTKKQTSQ